MSWLSKVADALEREPETPEVSMSAMDKLVLSRSKTVATLKSEIAEYEAQMAPLPVTSPARVALSSVVSVKRQRLAKVELELAGFLELAKDPRQAELPAVRKAGK